MIRATVDWKAVETLLNVSDKARQWPHLQALHDEAQDHLKDIHKGVSEARKRAAIEEKHKADVDEAAKAAADRAAAKPIAEKTLADKAAADKAEATKRATDAALPQATAAREAKEEDKAESPHLGLFGRNKELP